MRSPRSAGVAASAVVLIFMSTMAAFVGLGVLGGFVTLKNGGEKAISSSSAVVATGGLTLVVAAWGIATGAGLFRRRRWAWVSMLIIAALLAFASFPSLAAEPRLIRAITNVPTVGAFSAFIATQFGVLLLAVAVWWIVYFTRKSVRAQFGAAAAPSPAPPKP